MELRQAAIIPQKTAAPTISASPTGPARQARDPVTTRPSKGKKPAGPISRQTAAPASALKIASAAPKTAARIIDKNQHGTKWKELVTNGVAFFGSVMDNSIARAADSLTLSSIALVTVVVAKNARKLGEMRNA
ncbi:hypothetical protein BX666DRAFT_1874966 [Dichotomocladium elegans]|nr:hypothetical protein BX666DRAFT_1874966 [Dichotomocladium elegans]